MKLRGKILIAVGVIVIVTVLIPVIHHYQLRAATNAYIAELKAKGEPMDLAQVLPPRVPPEENSADTIRKATALFHANQSLLASNYFYSGMRMVAPGKAMVCAEQPDLRDTTATNSWAEVQDAVAQNAEAFALLRQIIDKPNFGFDVGYSRGVADLSFTNLSLAETKSAALRLGVAALVDLHQGNASAATENVRAMLAIAQAMRDEQLEISELVRVSIAAITIPDTWEILQSTNVTDGQLAALQNDWAKIEFLYAMEAAFAMERVTGAITIRQWRSSNSKLEYFFLGAQTAPWLSNPELTALDRLKIKSRIFRWRFWWSYQDELRSLKGYEFLLGAARAAQTNDALLSVQKELQSNIAKLSIPTNDNTFFWSSDTLGVDLHFTLSDSIPSSARIFSRVMRMEAAKRLTVVAIALRRYHLKHGAYPPALAALMPEFVAEVPRDPIDGQPLRYRLNPEGTFLLYSIGEDGKDGGGDVTPVSPRPIYWQRARDWVWPQPASAEEIRKFNENPPK